MKYLAPPKELFIQNRSEFASRMQRNSIALFFANENIHSNSDGTFPFVQNSTFYYFSGIDQENAILLLFPDAPREDLKEILFITKTNEHIQIWEGWKYSQQEAQAASGIGTVKFLEEFDSLLMHLIGHANQVYLDFNEHDRTSAWIELPANRFAEKLRTRFPAHQILRAAPIADDLRSRKKPAEIVQMQEAMNITGSAFDRVLKFTKPGVWEYEIEAEIQHEFLRKRATGPAYGSIIASGRNACVLHYVLNNAQCQDGDVILMDFGAEYGNYSADLSRSIPVNGKFTQRQKDVYNAVLRVMKTATAMLVPGNTLMAYHEKVGEHMTEELLKLGLLTTEEVKNQNKDWPAYKKYFMHGTSHFLGLDTHDVGNRYAAFSPGNVFTCEPGIYILEENLGIRIENDILITANGPVDLMKDIPREVEEIETLMAR